MDASRADRRYRPLGELDLAEPEHEEPPRRRRPAPGKVSLTASLPPRDVQLRGDPAAPHASVQAEARRGIAAPASRLPFLEELAHAFGPAHDLDGVRAHVGGEAEASARAMGAEAYATGSHVVLPSSPSLRLVAHEVTHTIQQRAGVQLSGGVGQVGDRYEREADDIADRVVRGERVGHLLAAPGGDATSAAIQRQAVAPETSAGLNVPNRDYAIEISNDGQGRFVVAGQIKVTIADAALASAKAEGTVDGGPAGDHDAQAKLDLFQLQQKAVFRTDEVQAKGRHLTERMSLSLVKPGAKLEVLPGLAVDVAGDLGQINFANGQLSVGSINFSVKGDVTTWVLGRKAQKAGLKAELIAQIKVKLQPGDLKHLVGMARNIRQLEKAEEAVRAIREVAMRDKARLTRLELAIAKARRQGARGAELVARLKLKHARVRAAIAIRTKALRAVRAQVKALMTALRSTASKLAARGARLVGKQILKVGGKLATAILRAASVVFLIIDLAEIGLYAYRLLDGTAEAALGGGGPGSLLKKGVPGGTAADGNSETEGASDAVGTGAGTGDDAGLAPDAGPSPDTDGDGAGDVDAGDGESSEDGAAGGDDEVDGGGALVDDVADDDGGDDDDSDAPEDDGGLGSTRPQKPDGGPGAGVSIGNTPSTEVTGGDGAADRNAPPDKAPGPPPDSSPADTTGAVAHDGSTPTSGSSATNTSTGDEPAELVTNANALRVMSALTALGQPSSPEIIALVEALIPNDLTPEEVDALIDELLLWLVPGNQAPDSTTIDGLTGAVSAFLQRRSLKRKGGAGGAGGDTKRGTGATTASKPAPTKPAVDHGRVVLKGHGLTPTVFEDGTLALTQEQAGKWLFIRHQKVSMSPAGAAWISAHKGMVVKTKPASMTLETVTVEGSPSDGERYNVAISFVLKHQSPVVKAISFTWEPEAPKGQKAQVPHEVSLASLEQLVKLDAFTATVATDVAADLGPFAVKVIAVHNAPYSDGTSAAPLSFYLTIEIVAVRDTALATFRGEDVKVGSRITDWFNLRSGQR